MYAEHCLWLWHTAVANLSDLTGHRLGTAALKAMIIVTDTVIFPKYAFFLTPWLPSATMALLWLSAVLSVEHPSFLCPTGNSTLPSERCALLSTALDELSSLTQGLSWSLVWT